MAGYLFFDTETTGTGNDARICQLAFMLTDYEGKAMVEFQSLIIPDGWEIEPGAAAVHGLTNELCSKFGISAKTAVQLFGVYAKRSDFLVGHNIPFDVAAIGRELRAYHLPDWLYDLKKFDTMLMATDVVKAPLTEKQLAAQERHKDTGWAPPGGWPKYKNPNLNECYKFFFGKNFDGAHDALADVRATRNIFFNLIDKETAQWPGLEKAD